MGWIGIWENGRWKKRGQLDQQRLRYETASLGYVVFINIATSISIHLHMFPSICGSCWLP
jgi:hypothetical protein